MPCPRSRAPTGHALKLWCWPPSCASEPYLRHHRLERSVCCFQFSSEIVRQIPESQTELHSETVCTHETSVAMHSRPTPKEDGVAVRRGTEVDSNRSVGVRGIMEDHSRAAIIGGPEPDLRRCIRLVVRRVRRARRNGAADTGTRVPAGHHDITRDVKHAIAGEDATAAISRPHCLVR